DGEYRWHLTRAFARRDDAGAVVGWAGTCTDIDDQRRAQGCLERLKAQLEDRGGQRATELGGANRGVGTFSYSVSHDLRSPLRAVDGFARIVQEEYGSQLPTDAKELLQEVRGGARRMGRLIDDLLEYSRLSRREVRTEVTQPEMLIERCL